MFQSITLQVKRRMRQRKYMRAIVFLCLLKMVAIFHQAARKK
ncbi:hypothetical protein CHCC20345_4161 [Bacillus licheniformis]|nr:hypothetical protein CHCC20345_4161 [Bacillus licheniformis]TWK65279.1 hypothetical protein CHCC20339_0664 [Bacillus licheniformis]